MPQHPSAALKWLAVVFLALTLACCAGMICLIFEGREALATPIELQPAFRLAREFYVPSSARYRIELRCSRTIAFEQLRHLLQGGNVVDVTLTEDGAPTQLSYLQQPRFRPGVVSTDEDGNLGFAQQYISQDIAVFTGHAHRRYVLSCSVPRPVAELAATHPMLVVGLDPLEIEGGAFVSFLLFVSAAFFALASLVLWGIYFYRSRRATRVQAAV